MKYANTDSSVAPEGGSARWSESVGSTVFLSVDSCILFILALLKTEWAEFFDFGELFLSFVQVGLLTLHP